MGTLNIYDSVTNANYTVTIDIGQNVISGGPQNGNNRYYITLTTSARDPDGKNIPTSVILDYEITDAITDAVTTGLVALFRKIAGINTIGTDLYLSSSSSSSTMMSSQTSAKSSSSTSSRLQGTTSSASSLSSNSSSQT